jgi:hypothetical protein
MHSNIFKSNVLKSTLHCKSEKQQQQQQLSFNTINLKKKSWQPPIRFYGGIFLPPTCKINYVSMQENYVNMQVTNVLGESDFNMGKITCVSSYLTSQMQEAT